MDAILEKAEKLKDFWYNGYIKGLLDSIFEEWIWYTLNRILILPRVILVITHIEYIPIWIIKLL